MSPFSDTPPIFSQPVKLVTCLVWATALPDHKIRNMRSRLEVLLPGAVKEENSP